MTVINKTEKDNRRSWISTRLAFTFPPLLRNFLRVPRYILKHRERWSEFENYSFTVQTQRSRSRSQKWVLSTDFGTGFIHDVKQSRSIYLCLTPHVLRYRPKLLTLTSHFPFVWLSCVSLDLLWTPKTQRWDWNVMSDCLQWIIIWKILTANRIHQYCI